MALRLSAKRATAALKAGNVSPVINGYLKRNASQATASASSVRDEPKHIVDVFYDVPVVSQFTDTKSRVRPIYRIQILHPIRKQHISSENKLHIWLPLMSDHHQCL